MSIVTINSDILKVLRQYSVNIDEAKMYLLGIYFNIDTQYISEKTRKQVNTLGIVEREYPEDSSKNKVVWKVALFNEEKAEAFAWITDWMDGFGRLNPSRKGTKSAVMNRMKKFFTQNPEVRVADVFAARDLYLKTITDPQFVKSSHKFIYEGAGFNISSMLEQYVTQVKESGISDGRNVKMRG